ncbi:MAG: hypothetical protein LBJ23_09155, partial [Tannerella sp.]|nr:hypothetical protein [Tannerella sp.]
FFALFLQRYGFLTYYQTLNNLTADPTYGADGKPDARYNYRGGELSEYYIFYPNTLDNPNEPPADMWIWSYAGTLHVRTAQPAVLHVYTPTGAAHRRDAPPAAAGDIYREGRQRNRENRNWKITASPFGYLSDVK